MFLYIHATKKKGDAEAILTRKEKVGLQVESNISDDVDIQTTWPLSYI